MTNEMRMILRKESYFEELEKEWKQSTPRLTEQELVQVFGKEEVCQILKDKILEANKELEILKNSFENKKSYIESRNFKESWHKNHYLGYLDRHTGLFIEQAEKLLEKYSRQYLTLVDKLPKSNDLQTYEIEKARRHSIIDLLDHDRRIRQFNGKTITNCPFHEDKNPSFVIYPDNGYHCFACGAHGNNAIDFVMKNDGLTFREAVLSL